MDKYKEAFGRAKKLHETCDSQAVVSWCEYIFPELKESEDEKTRKAIIEYLRQRLDRSPSIPAAIGSWIAWLEKQGEQKLIIDEILTATNYDKMFQNCNVHKFKVGDWITNGEKVWKIGYIEDDMYIEHHGSISAGGSIESIDKHYHLWTIQDAKDGDVLQLGKVTAIFQKYIGNGNCKCYCSVCDGVFEIPSKDSADNSYGCHNAIPATKEQRELLFQKMKEAGYEWDKEKKELKKIVDEEYNGEDYGIDSLWHAKNILEETLGKVDGYQTDDGILSHQCAITAVKKLYEQKPKRMISAEAKEAMYDKPAWSEEDECYMGECISAIATKDSWSFEEKRKTKHWLKSIKERYTWKPSDEQMKALHDLNLTGNISHVGQGQVLIGLYNDLKKLRGE